MTTTQNTGMLNSLVIRWGGKSSAERMAGLIITRERSDEAVILHLEGRLTLEETPALRSHLEDGCRAGTPRLVVNLAACRYVDTSGIAQLVWGMNQAQQAGVRFVIAGAGAQAKSLLKLSRLEKAFAAYATVAEALAA